MNHQKNNWGVSAELLWTNPNPSVDFSTQTISFDKDLTDYEYIYIDIASYNPTFRAPKTDSFKIEDLVGLNNANAIGLLENLNDVFYTANERPITIDLDDNSLRIENCLSFRSDNNWKEVRNHLSIPLRIYATKKSII